MYRNLSLEALGISATQSSTIEMALSNGFKGIDLDLVDFGNQTQAKGLPASRRLLDSAKLKFGGFTLPVDCEADEARYRADLDRLAKLAPLAGELGCTRAITLVAPASDNLPYHQNFEFHRKRYAEVASVLEPHGIRLGLGIQPTRAARQGKAFEFLHQFDALLMLLALVGRKNVGVLCDLWDLHLSGGGAEQIRKLPIDQIVAVRVADLPANVAREEAAVSDRALPAEGGQVDVPGCLVALAERGYDGPVTPWPNPQALGNVGREEMVRRCGQSLDQAWKSAGLTPAGKLAPAAKA